MTEVLNGATGESFVAFAYAAMTVKRWACVKFLYTNDEKYIVMHIVEHVNRSDIIVRIPFTGKDEEYDSWLSTTFEGLCAFIDKCKHIVNNTKRETSADE